MYAHVQATDSVNDHIEDCFVHKQMPDSLPNSD